MKGPSRAGGANAITAVTEGLILGQGGTMPQEEGEEGEEGSRAGSAQGALGVCKEAAPGKAEVPPTTLSTGSASLD